MRRWSGWTATRRWTRTRSFTLFVKSRIEDFTSDEPFDLITLRMVAEHVKAPARAVASLQALLRPGGVAVVYTVNRWAPVSMLAWLVPHRFHHRAKHLLWRTEEKDTFPVVYRMNTREELRRHFGEVGMRERFFATLDDCRTFARFKALHRAELYAWRAVRAVRRTTRRTACSASTRTAPRPRTPEPAEAGRAGAARVRRNPSRK